MTTENMTQGLEVAQLLDELTQKSVEQMRRDPSVPAGTVLEEHELTDGAVHREVKQNSMVRAGKVALPERFMAFDKFGNFSMLPTAQMGRMLAKERADSPGERAFHTHSGNTTRETCAICPPELKPIEGLRCNFCTGARAVRDTFTSEEQYLSHKRAMHEREHQAENEAMDRAERRASLEVQQKLAEAMLQAVQQNQPRGRQKAAEQTEE